MKTINDIINMMYGKDLREYCPDCTCFECPKYIFCWCNTRQIALDYIMREGTI